LVSVIIAGLEWVMDHPARFKVESMSLASGLDHFMDLAVKAAVQYGVTVWPQAMMVATHASSHPLQLVC